MFVYHLKTNTRQAVNDKKSVDHKDENLRKRSYDYYTWEKLRKKSIFQQAPERLK